MGRHKGSLNNLTLGMCPQCKQPKLLKTVRSRCDDCKRWNELDYHKKYMRKRYYRRNKYDR